ncbi:hypothetical protein [Desulfofustis glycolicus]|nr:hypothetical protein [Desulfofustis glycolicus]MCB2216159.1 hypothetical protein [Desulfobulbaceae bacterium]
MKSSPINLLTMSFLFLALSGIVLISLSFFSSLQASGRIMRAAGFAVLFFGIGEYLNHPPLVDTRPPGSQEAPIQPDGKRKRNPCGLGNFFDILAIISVFIVASYVLFPEKS